MPDIIAEVLKCPWHLAALQTIRKEIMDFTRTSEDGTHYDRKQLLQESRKLRKILENLEDHHLRVEAEIKELEYSIIVLEAEARQKHLHRKSQKRIFYKPISKRYSNLNLTDADHLRKVIDTSSSLSSSDIPFNKPLSSCEGDFERYMWQYYRSFHNRKNGIYKGMLQ